MKLPDRQQSILTFMQSYKENRGYPPTIREIAEGVGLSSSSTVHGHLDRLEKKGLIKRDPLKPRARQVVNIQN